MVFGATRPVLYLVLEPSTPTDELIALVEASLDGGVDVVQLREKSLTDREMLERASRLRHLTDLFGAKLIVNDRIDVALAAAADGVHLGVDDLPLASAFEIAPIGFEIGYSPEDQHQVHAAQTAGATYLGLGPIHVTTSKTDAGDPIGVAGFEFRAAGSKLPAIAIGGIQPADVAQLLTSGAAGVAVMSAITRSTDPREMAAQFRSVLDAAV